MQVRSSFAIVCSLLATTTVNAQCPGTHFALPYAGLNGQLGDLIQLSNGDIAVGGMFSTSNTTPAMFMAQLRNGLWSQFAGGADHTVVRFIQLADGDLLACGAFTQVGGVRANHIARWNGLSWSPLADGPPFTGGYANEMLLLPSGDLVVSGDTDIYSAARQLARWNGAEWTSMPPAPGSVAALALHPNGDLIAAGWFGDSSGHPIALAGRWDGTQWHALPGDFRMGGWWPHFAALALVVDSEGGIVVGGGFTFTSSDSRLCNSIARWDGSQWEAMADGLDGSVWSLAVLPSGDVVAGGSFNFRDLNDQCVVARWNGVEWSPLVTAAGTAQAVALRVTPSGGLIIGLTTPFSTVHRWEPATSDFNGDGDFGTDADVQAFFTCLAGDCCPTCYPGGSDFNSDGDSGTDADIESFFRVLSGGPC